MLLAKKPSETYIEMGGTSALPPIWVDIYEETQEKIKKIIEISMTCKRIGLLKVCLGKEGQKLVAKRIKLQFGDHAELDKQIEKRNSEATRV